MEIYFSQLNVVVLSLLQITGPLKTILFYRLPPLLDLATRGEIKLYMMMMIGVFLGGWSTSGESLGKVNRC